MVEPIVAIAECSMYGSIPLKTSRNSLRVGLKVNLGGQVSAADSGLNAVITIHSTGMKKPMPTTQAITVHPARRDLSRARRPPFGAGGAEGGAPVAVIAVTLPPRTGRRWRTA